MTPDPEAVALFRNLIERGLVEFQRQLDAEWDALPEVVEHDGVVFHTDLLR